MSQKFIRKFFLGKKCLDFHSAELIRKKVFFGPNKYKILGFYVSKIDTKNGEKMSGFSVGQIDTCIIKKLFFCVQKIINLWILCLLN